MVLEPSLRFEEMHTNIVALIESIVTTQKDWNITNNLTKTVILLELHGKGSRKLYKHFGKEIILSDNSKSKL